MKSPICRARQLVTEFLKYFDDEFEEEWIAPKNPIETNPDPLSLAAYEQAQRERDAFLEFYKAHSTLTTAESQRQCTLIDNGNSIFYLKTFHMRVMPLIVTAASPSYH